MTAIPKADAIPVPVEPEDTEDALGDLLSEMFEEDTDGGDFDEDGFDEDGFDKKGVKENKIEEKKIQKAPVTPIDVPSPEAAPTPVAIAPTPTPAPQPAPTPLKAITPAPAEALKTPAPATRPSVASPSSSDASTNRQDDQSTFVQPGPPRRLEQPFLTIRRFSIAGVEIAFPESQLSDPFFRASMPNQCVISGQTLDQTAMVARPMVFLNKDEKGNRHVRAVETQFEKDVDASYRHKDYIRQIGTVNGMTPPFDQPMPYLISNDLFHASLNCLSVRSDTHSGFCSIMIPAAATAAAWIAKVNGTANPAYQWLESNANQLSCEAWIRLPHSTRDRINAWCEFKPNENFLAYARHSDCTAKESGLGGVLVTNQRLLYKMFRKYTAIPLDQPCEIHIRHDAVGVHIAVKTNGGPLRKLGPINTNEIPLVFEALEQAASQLTIKTDFNAANAA